MKSVKDNEIQDKDYLFPYKKIYVTLTIIFCFFIGLFLNFPLKKMTKNFIEGKIIATLPCPLSYEEMDIGFFLPKIVFKGLTVPGECLGSQQYLKFKEAMVIFRGFGLSPLGIKIRLEAMSNSSLFNVTVVQSWDKRLINIDQSRLSLRELSEIFNFPKIFGDILIDSSAEIDKQNNLLNLQLQLSSNNLEIPVQRIMGFDIPSLPLQPLSLVAALKQKNEIQVTQVKVGSEKTPIRAQFKGSIHYTPPMPSRSELDLQGQVGFADAFLQQFPILPRIILKKFDNIDGNYQMKIRGTLSEPLPTAH